MQLAKRLLSLGSHTGDRLVQTLQGAPSKRKRLDRHGNRIDFDARSPPSSLTPPSEHTPSS